MEKKRILAVVPIILVLAGISYLVYYQSLGRNLSIIEATGTIEATTLDLNAKTQGVIQTLNIDEGDEVHQGQLVAALSRNDLLAQRERDALGVLKAEAQLADLLSGAREQEKQLDQAGVDIARINLKKASDDLARAQALFEEGAIPSSELEVAQTNRDLRQGELEKAEAKLSLTQSGNRAQQIAAARAEVERSKAVLKASEAMIEDLKIFAPLNGVVLSKNFETGEFIAAGSSVATVADLDHLWVKVFLPTDDLPRIKLGQKVQLTVSGLSDTFEGTVQEIASKGEFTPKTIQTKKERTNVVFAVKIKIPDYNGVLKPGMPADVTFPLETTHD